ncbi:sugar phosphate isomerase/epimerase family protein [Sphingomonas carotinifaciens]|uniref:Sugar phosphate isomerase/epimerase n=1 Tax=Sphingomonas carotinifaciens TaxID=1166323 RepID=A0A1G7P7D4_9SPHN|nr:sugar phosphate isomerase/epimerase [Sphingomonas carotinifaciens]MBB4087336.1 sugar phosphate isomerase/epimerase [Sphingomonas carotinifaciens]MWC44639.1 TIM barrel protein [Sphingomonas carotinifaciens]SDF82195.1 Sugar phosphate isomerase/epimerase [Sphingomonas carotinifaciens]
MTINRRHLLAGAGSLAALGLVGAPAFAAKLGPIGLQLYTVRELFQKDPVKTLETVAGIGYREVEFGGGGYDSMDHAMLRRTMDRLKLTAPSVHIGYDALLGNFAKSVAMAKTLGAGTVILPYMTDEHRTEAGWQAALPNINRFANDLRAAGLNFAYHNHDFEFTVKPGGVSLYERLLRETDPALVKVELDLYWVAHAGEDVPAWIERLADRLYAYHVKDMRPDRSMTAVGAGVTDFAALFRLKGSAGVRHFYVENDEAPAPYIPDITKSFQTLRALRV